MNSLKTELPDASPRENQQWLKKVAITYEEQRDTLQEALNDKNAICKRKIHVSGFPISVDDTEKVDEMKRKIVDEVEASSKIKQELHDAGITPIGILPEDIFTSIVKEAGLYTFSHMTKDGKVKANGKDFSDAYSFSNNDGSSILSILANVALWVGPGICFSAKPTATLTHKFIGVALILIGVIAIALAHSLNDNKDKSWFKKGLLVFTFLCPISMLIRHIYKKHILSKAKKYLWPDKSDIIEKDKMSLIDIILPTPPQSIHDMLFCCHKSNIKTFLVVEEKAFGVVLDEKTLSRISTEHPKDPIIAYKSNKMIAVLDQFGDFKGEQQVIEYVKKHFAGIAEDLLQFQQN